MKASEFDKAFDAGEDVTDHLELTSAQRPQLKPKRVNVDFPTWMVQALDREAKRLGIARQAVIKLWISDRLAQAARG